MNISPAFLEKIKNNITLSDLIARKVKLIRAGQEFKGLCPFHLENTPSFTVNNDKQFYHCFGCGAHGDAVSFVMQSKNLTFINAVRLLASMADLELPPAANENSGQNPKTIDRYIRKNIFDGLRIENIRWCGVLDDIDFLSRLYDLGSLPSYDSRFPDAEGDIFQHTINNEDWPLDWIYTDSRFHLLDGPDSVFLNFLCEMIHPVVRPDKGEAKHLVENHFNVQLNKAGWKIIEDDFIAGRPLFKAIQPQGNSDFPHAKKIALAFDDSGYIRRQIIRMETAVNDDPELAIGTAKELIETCCKSILDVKDITYGKCDFPKLVKLTLKELKLLRDDIPASAKGAKTIKNILSNLSTITEGINDLRSYYGTGHGKGASHISGIEPRHAQLAVSSAVTFAYFVTETFLKQTKDS